MTSDAPDLGKRTPTDLHGYPPAPWQCGGQGWETWEQTLLLLDSGRLDLEWLITHRKPLGQIDQAVDLLTGEACKVLLVPGLS